MFRVVARWEYALKATGYDQAEGSARPNLDHLPEITNPAFMERATELGFDGRQSAATVFPRSLV